MRLTEEEYMALEPFEKHMETALRAGWSRNPGVSALDTMQRIYNRVSKSALKINKGCGVCILNLLKDVGRIYFADKKEKEPERLPAERTETPESGHVVASDNKSVRAKKKMHIKTKSEEHPRDIQPPIDRYSLREEF